jgi:hypothetical protein
MVGVGSLAAQRLLDLLATGNDRPVNTVVPTELVVRDSCGCTSTGRPVALATTTSTGRTA